MDVFHGYYWTGTESARLPGQAWYIHLGGAKVYRGMKNRSYMVWPVAGTGSDKDIEGGRWVDHGHGFFDRWTQRSWLYGPWTSQGPMSWQEALDCVKAANHEQTGGHSDWRLPNIRELESLADVTVHSPAFSKDCPLPVVREGYWSGTTSLYEPRYAWALYTQDGALGVGFKAQKEFCLLAIRSG